MQPKQTMKGKTLVERLADVEEANRARVQTPPTNDIDAVVRQARAARANGGAAAPVARSCLIVDDSRVVRKVSRKIATAVGYDVTEAENGEEALARCRKSMPDLILLDWNMPVMTGIEFVTALRKLPTRRRPQVIFCTSKAEARDIHEGIAAGADDFLVKPFDEAGLTATLQASQFE